MCSWEGKERYLRGQSKNLGWDAGARKLDWHLSVALCCVEGTGCLYIRVDQSLDASFPRGTGYDKGLESFWSHRLLLKRDDSWKLSVGSSFQKHISVMNRNWDDVSRKPVQLNFLDIEILPCMWRKIYRNMKNMLFQFLESCGTLEFFTYFLNSTYDFIVMWFCMNINMDIVN